MKQHKKAEGPAARRSRKRAAVVAAPSAPLLSKHSGADSAGESDPTPSPAGIGGNAAPQLAMLAAAPAAPAGVSATSTHALTPAAVGTIAAERGGDTRRAQAERIVKDYVPLAIGAGMIPLPAVDLIAIAGLQLKVLASLAEHYGVPFTKRQAELIVRSLLGSVGTTILAGAALGSVAKILPCFGTIVGVASMPTAGGVITRAMGHLVIDHFEAGGTMETFDVDLAQAAFLAKIAQAKTAVG